MLQNLSALALAALIGLPPGSDGPGLYAIPEPLRAAGYHPRPCVRTGSTRVQRAALKRRNQQRHRALCKRRRGG